MIYIISNIFEKLDYSETITPRNASIIIEDELFNRYIEEVVSKKIDIVCSITESDKKAKEFKDIINIINVFDNDKSIIKWNYWREYLFNEYKKVDDFSREIMFNWMKYYNGINANDIFNYSINANNENDEIVNNQKQLILSIFKNAECLNFYEWENRHQNDSDACEKLKYFIHSIFELPNFNKLDFRFFTQSNGEIANEICGQSEEVLSQIYKNEREIWDYYEKIAIFNKEEYANDYLFNYLNKIKSDLK